MWNLGDSLSGPLFPEETAQYLMAQPWFQLAGNHERQVLERRCSTESFDADAFTWKRIGARTLEWLKTLSPVGTPAPGVLLCHGSPRSDLEYLLESADPASGLRLANEQELSERLDGVQADLVVCGHSHVPRALRVAGTLLVNPGSVGLQAYASQYPTPHVVENGSVEARYAIVERVLGAWRAELHSVPYAHESCAKLARERGADRWAHALATGRVAPH